MSNDSDDAPPPSSFFLRGDAWAVAGGGLAIGLAVATRFVIGEVYSGYEARVLLESLIGGGLYLVSAIVGASATIVALMLTILGLARSSDSKFSPALYRQIRRISVLASVVLVLSVLTLLIMTIPVHKADNLPSSWIRWVYYVVSASVATLSGATITLVFMLLSAVLAIIRTVSPAPDRDD